MKYVLASAALGGLVALSACAPQQESFPELQTIEKQACPAASLQSLIGAGRSAADAYAWTPKRVIDPGMAVTQDYLRNRLNFRIDDAGNIAGIYCG